MERHLGATVSIAIAMTAAVGFVAIADQVNGRDAPMFDESVAQAIRRLDSPVADTVMSTITEVGATPALVVAIAVTAVLALSQRWWWAACLLVANGLVIAGLNRVLKTLFARERPVFEPEIPLPGSFSFPSGHASSSLAVYGSIAAVIGYLFPRTRVVVLAATVLLVLAIGVSRVYLGVHWPLDVLAGYAAAAPPLVVTVYLLRVSGVR